jgi:hypothetical protein
MNIVTGFISGINERKDRDLTKYIDFAKELFCIEIPITVFIERHVFDKWIRPEIELFISEELSFSYVVSGGFMDGIRRDFTYIVSKHIRFVFFEKEDLFLWPYKELASKFSVHTGNPEKDTLGYMMVQSQKSEWLCIANQIDSLYSEEKEWVWMDFGIFHMFRGNSAIFRQEIESMQHRILLRLKSGSVRKMTFAGCWSETCRFGRDIYKDIYWVFAGSVFGGNAASIFEFACYMREKCMQIMREYNTLMWEVNIWVLLLNEHPDLIQRYQSDHNTAIFAGYAS